MVTETRIEIGRDSDGYYYGRVYDTTPGDFCGQNLYAGPAGTRPTGPRPARLAPASPEPK